MPEITFDCGCRFQTAELPTSRSSISLDIDKQTKLYPSCQKTWDLLCDGHVKGIFQVEGKAGRQWVKQVKPNNLEEQSALIALIRPGCLESQLEGKNLTQHFCDRKAGTETVVYPHIEVEAILSPTHGILVYQEQAIRIAEQIANFSAMEADILRKAIGKKKPEIMAECKKTFLTKAKEYGCVEDSVAEEMFGWIEKSQRYSFNKSHSMGYAVIGYWTAYVKAHFDVHFYRSWLNEAHNKQDFLTELRELVKDARKFDVDIRTPSLLYLNKDFEIRDDKIYFGFGSIKGMGEAAYTGLLNAIRETEDKIGPRENWTWQQTLFFFSPKVNTTTMRCLIGSGALSYMNVDRALMDYQYSKFSLLTDKEIAWIQHNNQYFDSVLDAFKGVYRTRKDGGATASPKRSLVVESLYKGLLTPSVVVEDTPHSIVTSEEKLLGVAITTTNIEGCDVGIANTTIRDFLAGNHPRNIMIAGEIKEARVIKVKKQGKNHGRPMAFLTIEDHNDILNDITVFPDTYDKYQDLISEESLVMLQGTKDKGKNSIVVQKIWRLKLTQPKMAL